MTPVFPIPQPPRFSLGSRIGRCTVAAYLGREKLGERYAVFYGTTNHLLDLIVPPAGESTPTLEDYRAYMRRLEPVARHPALAHCFAAGSDPYFGTGSGTSAGADDQAEPAPQLPWLRVEHVAGVPQWALASKMDSQALASALPQQNEKDEAAMLETREKPDIPTLALFIAASGGKADPGELARLLGDILGAISALHHAKLSADAPTCHSIALDRAPHSATPVARLVRYAQKSWSVDAVSTDLAAFAAIIRESLAALPASSSLAATFEAFAGKIESGAYPTAQEAYAEYPKILAAAGISGTRSSGTQRGQSPSPSSRTSSHGSSSHRHHHRRKPAFYLLAGDSEAMRRVKAFFGAGFFIAALVAIGVAVYVYMVWSDSRARERYAQTLLSDAPVVTVIPTEIEGEEKESGATAAYHLSGPALASAVASGEPFAMARAAIGEILSAAPAKPAPEAIAKADSAMSEILPDLLDAAPEDIAAAFLRGTGALLALGRPHEPEVAWRELEISAKAGFPLASVLYGDMISGGADGTPADGAPDAISKASASERQKNAIKFYRAAADAVDSPLEVRIASENRIVALLKRLQGNPDEAFVGVWSAWVEKTAANGNIPAMALLAEPGIFSATNAVTSLDWLRHINKSPTSSPDVKAWAQTRMAARFAAGIGTPASESAARVWYERAAKLGNRQAMLKWAEYLETGKGEPNGLRNPDAAAEWKTKAESAGPEPDFEPAWWPTSPFDAAK